MIIVLKKQIEKNEKEHIVDYLSKKGFRVREIQGESDTVLGAVGSAAVDRSQIQVLPGVAEVIPISKPYKLASREFKKEDTVIKVGGVKIGGNRFCVMGGPCAVENRQNRRQPFLRHGRTLRSGKCRANRHRGKNCFRKRRSDFARRRFQTPNIAVCVSGTW